MSLHSSMQKSKFITMFVINFFCLNLKIMFIYVFITIIIFFWKIQQKIFTSTLRFVLDQETYWSLNLFIKFTWQLKNSLNYLRHLIEINFFILKNFLSTILIKSLWCCRYGRKHFKMKIIWNEIHYQKTNENLWK